MAFSSLILEGCKLHAIGALLKQSQYILYNYVNDSLLKRLLRHTYFLGGAFNLGRVMIEGVNVFSSLSSRSFQNGQHLMQRYCSFVHF